jgi:glycine/D-amino acid oxidase-like deaminating enzyme
MANEHEVTRTPHSLVPLHWLRAVDHAEFPVPEGPAPARAEVVVVGGGYLGASTALWLARMGAEPVVVERRGIATGASGRNAGFIAPGLGQPFAEAVARHGRAGALDRLNFTRRGRDLALALIKELGIECELEQSGGLVLGASDEEWEGLRASGEGLRREGFPIEVLSPEDLRAHLHVPVPPVFRGALFNPETILVNPAKLARAWMREAVRLGARVFPSTEVTALTDQPNGRIMVETSRGEIDAGRVVLATNAWTPLIAGLLKDRISPVRGQIFATEPAPPTFKRGMSTNYGYEYWSQRADGAIVLGGGRWATADRDEGYYAEEVNPAIQSALERFLTDTFASLRGIKVARRWSGIMGFSRDVYPFIGPAPGRERLITVAGFTGHGGPYAAIAGRCVAELIIRGRSDEPLDHYALDRPLPAVEPDETFRQI